MNPAAERIFGYQAEELIGRHFNRLMPETERAEYEDYVRAHLGLGNDKAIGFGLEITGQRKDGSAFPNVPLIYGAWSWVSVICGWSAGICSSVSYVTSASGAKSTA